jgi:hypothetical protein
VIAVGQNASAASTTVGRIPHLAGISRRMWRLVALSSATSTSDPAREGAAGEGHSYKTAAFDLGVSINTIAFHLQNIYGRLRVHSKSEAVPRVAGKSSRVVPRSY